MVRWCSLRISRNFQWGQYSTYFMLPGFVIPVFNRRIYHVFELSIVNRTQGPISRLSPPTCEEHVSQNTSWPAVKMHLHRESIPNEDHCCYIIFISCGIWPTLSNVSPRRGCQSLRVRTTLPRWIRTLAKEKSGPENTRSFHWKGFLSLSNGCRCGLAKTDQ